MKIKNKLVIKLWYRQKFKEKNKKNLKLLNKFPNVLYPRKTFLSTLPTVVNGSSSVISIIFGTS